MRLTSNQMAMAFIGFLCIISVFYVSDSFKQTSITTFGQNSTIPKIAGVPTVINTWPADGAILPTSYPISKNNFTSTITNNSYPPTTWDSGNLFITYSGGSYSNQSIDAGLYNASYTFTNDADLSMDSAFTVTSGTAQIESAFQGHSKIMQLVDPATSHTTVNTVFTGAGATGNISFWWLSTTVTSGDDKYIINVYDAGGTHLLICLLYSYVTSGQISAYYGAANHNLCAYSANTWYFITIAFDSNSDIFSLYLNQGLIASAIPYREAGGNPASSDFRTGDASSSYSYYDAIDYSWMAGYTYWRAYSALLIGNESFQTIGSYTYQFQVWQSGIRYDCPSVAFSVFQPTPVPPSPEYPDIYTGFYILSSSYLVSLREGENSYFTDSITLNMNLNVNDQGELYSIRLCNMTDVLAYPGGGAGYQNYGTWFQGTFLSETIESRAGTVSVQIKAYLPIYQAHLHFYITPISPLSGIPMQYDVTFGAGGAAAGNVEEYILGDFPSGVVVNSNQNTNGPFNPLSERMVLESPMPDLMSPNLQFGLMGYINVTYPFFTASNFFFMTQTSGMAYDESIGPFFENRIFTANLIAANTSISASGFMIGIKLHNFYQAIWINETSNIFSIPIVVNGFVSVANDFQFLIYDAGALISNTTQYLNQPSFNVTLPAKYARYNIYFSCFSNDLLGVPIDSIRLYIDGARRTWGLQGVTGALHSIVAMDYFNETVFNSTIDLSVYDEFNIFVNLCTVTIHNLEVTENLTISIKKSGIKLLSQALAPGYSLMFRFIAPGVYTINAMYDNGTLAPGAPITLSLAENSTEICSFGVRNVDLPPIEQTNFTIIDMILGMLLVGGIVYAGARESTSLGRKQPIIIQDQIREYEEKKKKPEKKENKSKFTKKPIRNPILTGFGA